MLRAVLLKTLIVAVGGALVLPFVAAAVLVGARAVAGAGGTRQALLMFAIALVWTLFGGVKGFARGTADGREGHDPSAAQGRATVCRQTFLGTRGF
jgi:membrane protein implicated in regulation of membrane protease activity